MFFMVFFGGAVLVKVQPLGYIGAIYPLALTITSNNLLPLHAMFSRLHKVTYDVVHWASFVLKL